MKKQKSPKKKDYEPPKATYFALKMEERLLACQKCSGNSNSPRSCNQRIPPGTNKAS